MPRPTDQLSALPPFSRQVRQSLDETSLPSIPRPPSPPSIFVRPATTHSTALAFGAPIAPPIPVSQRYSTIPLISSGTDTSSSPDEEVDAFYNILNTGVYDSLSRIPSYRLPSPVSLPSRHNSRIQRDRGMSGSPVSPISISDAPITSRYSYLIQPLSGIPQSPSPPDMPQPPPPPGLTDENFNSTLSTMGAPPSVDLYNNQGQSSRAAGLPLPPINESTPNLQSSSRLGTGYISQDGAPTTINNNMPLQDVSQQSQPQPQPHQHPLPPPQLDNTMPAEPRNAFRRAQDFAGRRFNQLQTSIMSGRRQNVTRSRSISQFVRRHRRRSNPRPPTPALAIIGLVTSFLVFIALMTFLWFSTQAGNIVAVVYSFSVLCACCFVLFKYHRQKRMVGQDEERDGSRLSLFRDGASTQQPEMDMVQESEIVVIPRMPVHRVVGEAEADPELPPYSRGNAADILDVPSAPAPGR